MRLATLVCNFLLGLYGLILLCEGPEPFVYGGEAGAHKGGDEDFREVVGFEFVADEANEGGTDNEEV